MKFILAEFAVLAASTLLVFIGLLLWANFVAGGNWLEEEQQYVRWRHYAGVKLKLIKPTSKRKAKP